MRAAVFDSSFDIKLKDVTSAAPGPGEVEVRAKAAGLCAGDLYIYLGKNPYVTFPRVGGHEIAGVVSAVGPGVAEVARARGAEVFITDIQRERLATARELGAQPLPAGDVAARSLQLTNGEGMPVVIEAGTASVMEQRSTSSPPAGGLSSLNSSSQARPCACRGSTSPAKR